MNPSDSRPQIEIGAYTYGDELLKIRDWDYKRKLKIGKYCSISAGVIVFLDGCDHHTDWITTYPLMGLASSYHRTCKGDVIVGNAVWIGENATILSGVTIGDGAVIGACSVVVKDVPPYTLAAGNPARVRKKLFSDQAIENLLKIKWWDWPKEKIKERAHLLCSNNFIEFFELEGL